MPRTFRSIPILIVAIVAVVSLWPTDALAQRRAVRRPVRSAVFVAVRPYYSPSFYRRVYSPWYAWHPFGFHGGYAQYSRPYRGWYDDMGSARIEVQPRDAEVFIDGYFVGQVDDFDGWLQRLHVRAGEHELEIYKEGFRTFRQNVLIRRDGTLKIEAALQPLGPGEASEPRPTPREGASAQDPPRPGRGGQPVPAPRRGESDYGALALRVQPLDAEIYVDGERWQPSEGGDRLVIQLAAGEHRIEIRRDGYRTYATDVRVRADDTTTLNVSLTRQ